MKRPSNNPKGRPLKGDGPRKAVSYRLTPSAIEKVKKASEEFKVSQSDILIKIIDESYLTD